MYKSKQLTEDQIDMLETLSNDFIAVSDVLHSYLKEIVKGNEDCDRLCTMITIVQDKVSVLTKTATENSWENLFESDEENNLFSSSETLNNNDDER